MYAKLFSRITESSLMDEDVPTRYVFIMMLAIADKSGIVVGTNRAIARRINISESDFSRCLKKLMDPDPHSNNQDHEGRRVIESDGERGYKLVSYEIYRDLRDQDNRREYMREYMKEYREKKGSGKPVSLRVNSVNSGKPIQKQRHSQTHLQPPKSPKPKPPLTGNGVEAPVYDPVWQKSPLP